MDGQDELIDILVETYENNVKKSFGALCFEGTMHMMDEYGELCYDETDSWTLFGDPSLQVRTDTPSSLSVNHDVFVPPGATEFEVEVVFADTDDASPREAHPYDEYVFVAKGAILVTRDDHEAPELVEGPAFFHIPPNTHHVFDVKKAPTHVVVIHPERSGEEV